MSKPKAKSRKVTHVVDTRDEHYGKIPRPKDFGEEDPASYLDEPHTTKRKGH